MSRASRCFSLGIMVTALLVPLVLHAAVNPSDNGTGGSTKDACKTGKVELGSDGKAVTGGDTDTNNYIRLTKDGRVIVSCRQLAEGEESYVTFCDLDGFCKTVAKGSTEGGNLMRLYGSASAEGKLLNPRGTGWTSYESDAQTILQNILSTEQMNAVDKSLIGKISHSGQYMDYSAVLDKIGYSTAHTSSAYNQSVLSSTANEIISAYALDAKTPVSSLDDPIQRNVGQPYRIDVLTPSQNMMYYGPQYVPTFEPARAFIDADFAKLKVQNSYTPTINTGSGTFIPSQSAPSVTSADLSKGNYFSGLYSRVVSLFSILKFW